LHPEVYRIDILETRIPRRECTDKLNGGTVPLPCRDFEYSHGNPTAYQEIENPVKVGDYGVGSLRVFICVSSND
jgi:hypothetical protein